MKRVAVIGVVAAVLAVAPALAVVRSFSGNITGHPALSLDFDVIRHSGTDEKVKDLVINRIAVDCDKGHQRITPPGSYGPAPIDGSGHFKLVEPPVRFSGTVHASSAKGTLRVHGSFSGSSQNCDSGSVDWHASH